MTNTTINQQTIAHLEWLRDNANNALSAYTNKGDIFNTLILQGDDRLIAECTSYTATFLLTRIDNGWNTQNCKDYLTTNACVEWSSSAIGTALSAIKSRVYQNILTGIKFIFDD